MREGIRFSIRTALIAGAAMATTVAWAQAPEPPTSTDPATSQHEPTRAQDSRTDATAPATSTASTTIDDRKIDQFADAYVAVQKIQTEAAAELDSAAGDPTKQQQTQAKVENDMIAAVERTGLKLDEFNGIVQTMSADADLRARVVAKIKQKMGG